MVQYVVRILVTFSILKGGQKDVEILASQSGKLHARREGRRINVNGAYIGIPKLSQ